MRRAETSGGGTAGTEVRIRCKDGSTRDAIFSATLTPDGPIVAFQDITARKKADQARAEADRSMKLAASAARLGFWEIDIATRLDRWDAEMARIHGIRHEDFDGHWEKFVHPDD